MMADSIPAITTAKELVAAETTSSIKASEPTVVASDLPISSSHDNGCNGRGECIRDGHQHADNTEISRSSATGTGIVTMRRLQAYTVNRKNNSNDGRETNNSTSYAKEYY